MEQKNFWCIVAYIGATPFYYTGYYKSHGLDEPMKPAISISFDDAMKLHSQEEAKRILQKMSVSNWIVEEHAYF